MPKVAEEIQRIKTEIAKRGEIVSALIAQYPESIVLRKDDKDMGGLPMWRGAIIHPSSRTAGRFQVSIFDANGFAYDYSEATYFDAVKQAYTEGFRIVDMDLLEREGETPQFMAGCIWSMLPDDKKWSTRLADVRETLEQQAH